ncbi:MAG: Slp family lipoprotein [Thermodesulfobacteriota bacterium]
MIKKVFLIFVALLCLSACAHVIPQDVLQEADRDLSFSALQKAPEEHKGKMVVLGGVIVGLSHKEEGSVLEVYQTALNQRGKPVNLDSSEGRFLALYQGLLESEIYRTGRRVTIAGTVQGSKVKKLGEIDYLYPYILIEEIHLWGEEKAFRYEPYPWDFWYPWWDPWYPWIYRRHPFW